MSNSGIPIVEDVAEVIGDVADFAIDDVINPIVDTATDIVDAVLDDPIKAAAQITAIATGNAWALPLIEGADVAIDGGDIGDILESTAKAYVAQQVGGYAGKTAGAAAAGAGAGEVASTVIGVGSGRAASAVVLGQDPVKAFITGGISAGVPAALGQVDGFTDLPVSAQKVIEASITAELTGGEVDANIIANAIIRANVTSEAVQEYAEANGGNIPDSEAALVADIIANTATTAFAGGNVSQAVQNSVMRYGARELNSVIDRNVRNTIDNISGSYDKVEAQARELERLKDANLTAIDNYNAVVDRMTPRFTRRDELFAEYERLNEAFQNDPNQANADAVNNAIKAYNDYAEQLDKDITETFQPELDKYEKEINDTTTAFETGTDTYNELRDDLVSKSDQLGSELEPMYEATNRAFVQAMDPNFNEAEYKELNGLGDDVNAYEHFLEEGQFDGLPTNMGNAEGTILSEKMRLLDDALESKGLSVSNLDNSQISNLYSQIDRKYGSNINDLKNATIGDLNVDTAFRGANKTKLGDSATDLYKATSKLPEGANIASGEEVANGTAKLVTTEEGGRWVTYTVPKGYWDPNSGDFIATENIPEGVPFTSGYSFSELKDADPNAYLETIANGDAAIESSVGSYVYDFAVNAMNLAKDSESSTLQNAAANALKAGGGILQAFNGLVILAGENPGNTELGKFSKALVDLGAAGNTEEYQAAIADINAQIGEAKGFVGTAEAIFGAFTEHPTEFLAEYVGVEGMQELVPLLIGGGATTFARGSAKLLGATDDFARVFGSRSGLGAAAVTDVAESFGGAAESAYQDAYNTAIAQGLSEEQATQTALEIATRTGTVSAMATAVSFGMGGDALETALLGNKATGKMSGALTEFADRIARGGTVTIAEGVTEGIEEGISQLYLEGQLYQLDPNRDIAGNIASATIFGAIAGSGVSGGAYAAGQTGDIIGNVLTTSNTEIKNLIDTAPKNATGAQQVQNKLNEIGVTSNVTQANVLNNVYNSAYTSTNEAYQSFSDYEYYTPTDDEIYSFVGNISDTDRNTQIESYIDPRYVDENELRAIAEEEGITLTDEQIAEYVGQKEEASALDSAREAFDPLATTYEEAKQFFNDLGYTPTYDEITSYVGGAESDQQAAIGTYVDPLYTDFAEAKEFLEGQGYTPTDEEVQRFVGQIQESQQETAIQEYVDPRLVTEDEVVAAYEALGLTRPTDDDVQELIGQYMEEELGGRAEEYLPTARYNSIISLIEELGGGAVSPEMQEALDIVKNDITNALGDLGLEVATIDQTTKNLEEAVGKIASGEEEATGLYAYIDSAVQDLKDAGLTNEEVEATVTDIVGSPATDDAAATGLYAEFETLGTDVADIQELLGAPATEDAEGNVVSATGLYGYIDTAVESLGTDISNLAGTVGKPAVYGEDGAIVEEATGVFAEIDSLMAQGLTNAEAIAQVAADLGVAVTDLTSTISDVETGLSEEIGGVSEDVGALAGIIGQPAIADDPSTEDVDESRDPTGLFSTIAQYEAAGQERDQAIQNALSDLATDLGTTEQNILNELGLTEIGLTEVINKTEADILAELGDVETELGEKITGVEETLGADIEAVADLVGKPVQDVTDVDIDFVADLIAQQEVLSDPSTFEFTDQQLGYDVTGDGVVNQLDLDLLTQAQQGQQVEFAPESKFAQPTGLYGTVQDTKTELEQAIDLSQQTLSQEIKEAEERQFKMSNVRQLQDMLMQAGDIGGQQVTVKSPDPARIGYMYDFSSIFATPQQQALFPSPYAEGGEVENPNDELLRLLEGK